MDKTPKVRQKKSILFLAWLAPIVAILISYTMLDDYFASKGSHITIYCKDVKGLSVRKSHIEYKGIQIGDLKTIKPDFHDIKQFIIEAQIYKEYNYLIKEGSKFWIVEPSIGVNKIENIGTVLTGNYIELIPATLDSYDLSNLPSQKIFTAIEDKPELKGLIVNLRSETTDVSIDDSIKYKGFTIGRVIAKELEKSTIAYTIKIEEKYEYLINKHTYFYHQKPLEIKINEKELLFEIAPIKDMLSGTIVLINDDTLFNDTSILYSSKNDLYYKEEKGIEVDLLADDTKEDTKVFYKGFEIGYVKTIFIQDNQKHAKLFIKDKYAKYITKNTKFYKQSSVTGDISFEGIKFELAPLKEMLFGSIVIEYNKGSKDIKGYQYKLYSSKDAIKDEAYEKNIFEITLSLENLDNIKMSSNLYYKNVKIGKVKDIYLQNEKAKVKIAVNNKYKNLFGRTATIYIEGIKVSLSEVKNLATEVLGDKLILVPSKNNGFKTSFNVNVKNPIDSYYKAGMRLTIVAKDAKDIKVNTPIMYKYIQIGNIESIVLNKNDEVEVNIFIEKQYAKYINESCVFYLDKMFDASFSLFGETKIDIGSASTLLNGGINIKHITDTKVKNKNKNGEFVLYKNLPF